MKGFEGVSAFFWNCLWSLCLAIPVLGELLGREKEGVAAPSAISHEWLSLPFDFRSREDPLSGWEIFNKQDLHGDENELSLHEDSIPVIGVDDLETPEPLEQRIKLFGYIEEGGVPMYCFFDTQENRWFRLIVDQTDPESGVKLAQADREGKLMLVDSLAGQRFLLGRDSLSLQPMDSHE